MTRGTITGRFTRSEPNIQEVNSRTEEGRALRKAFDEQADRKPIDWTEIEHLISEHNK